MGKHKMSFKIMVIFAMFVIQCSFISLAATNHEQDIERVTIKIDANVPENGGNATLDVSAENDSYTVDSFQFTGGKTSFKSGDVPRIDIVLLAEDDFKFSTGLTTKKVSIRGQGTCINTKRLDSGRTLEITVRLNPVAVTVGDISSAYWVENSGGKARWDSAQNANAYEVKLYHKDSVVKHVDKTTTTAFDFRNYMTKVGDYYFKVRTIPRNSEEAGYIEAGEWVSSSKLHIDSSKASSGDSSQSGSSSNTTLDPNSPGAANQGPGATEGTGTGTLPRNASYGWTQAEKGWKYLDGDGHSPLNIWTMIDNKWYFFDMTGYMKTGWHNWNGGYYYLTVNGDMLTGWTELERKWYYLGTDGRMCTGWLRLNDTWYFMSVTGMMATEWQMVDDKWYYFDPVNGAMATNTTVGGSYVGSDGSLTGK